MNVRKWNFWKAMRDWCNGKMTDAWMEKGNCDSACERCGVWESHGSKIANTDTEAGTTLRVCSGCGHTWETIFTPAGFVPTRQADPNNGPNHLLGEEFFGRAGFDTSTEPYTKTTSEGRVTVYKNKLRDGSGRYDGFIVTKPECRTVRTLEEYMSPVTPDVILVRETLRD